MLARYPIDAVCGPLVEGALVASLVAPALAVPFTYTERSVSSRTGLFPVDYVLPAPFRDRLRGRRVAIVNDVINAGSAVRGTLAALQECGAQPVAIGTLAVLGRGAVRLASEARIPLAALVTLPNEIWPAAECPLCARQIPLDDLTRRR